MDLKSLLSLQNAHNDIEEKALRLGYELAAVLEYFRSLGEGGIAVADHLTDALVEDTRRRLEAV